MKARPQLTGEQLVQDYLGRLAHAARMLPKGARIAFVGRTRAAIESQLGPLDTAGLAQVMAVLEGLGRPEDLVREERIRIDRGWLKSRAGSEAEGDAAAGALTGPRVSRPLTSRRRPTSDTMPLFGRPAQPPAAPGTGSRGPRPPGSRPRGAGPPADGPQANGSPANGSRVNGSAGPPAAAPGPEDAQGHGSLDWLAGHGRSMHTGPGGGDSLAANAGRLARAHILETVATLLLGIGGIVLPFPFWPLGAIAAMFSRLWDVRDKFVAVLGPLAVVLVASGVTAAFIGGKENVILIYSHALHVGFGPLIRAGCVASAAYLAWRVSQGPRIKVPPWRRTRR
jgi:hypothetical protein